MIRTPHSTDTRSHAEAARWHARFREFETEGSELSPEEIEEWTRFCADPIEVPALDLMERAASMISTLRRPAVQAAGAEDDLDYDGSLSVKEWRARQGLTAEKGRRATSVRHFEFLERYAIAASLVLVVIVAGLVVIFPRHESSLKEIDATYRTRAGETENVMLSDGSAITMGPGTEINVSMTPRRRLVRLDSGVALFSVAHDKSRPFEVAAGETLVTAVGTRFNVHLSLDRVTVTVTEGIVDVRSRPNGSSTSESPQRIGDEPPARSSQLKAGEEITYDTSSASTIIRSADPAVTGWVTGTLAYRDVPLRYVIADINRYQTTQFILKDAVAGDYEFTGTIFQDHLSDFARSLERIFPVRVDQSQDGRIVIESRENTP